MPDIQVKTTPKEISSGDTTVPPAGNVAVNEETTQSAEQAPSEKVEQKPQKKISVNSIAESLQNSVIAGNIPQIVLHMITYATDLSASDIHIEPQANIVRIRFRADGVLRLIIEYPSNIHPAVVSRIKIMSGLKIDEQRIPQKFWFRSISFFTIRTNLTHQTLSNDSANCRGN